jgi:hypothetical protein
MKISARSPEDALAAVTTSPLPPSKWSQLTSPYDATSLRGSVSDHAESSRRVMLPFDSETSQGCRPGACRYSGYPGAGVRSARLLEVAAGPAPRVALAQPSVAIRAVTYASSRFSNAGVASSVSLSDVTVLAALAVQLDGEAPDVSA